MRVALNLSSRTCQPLTCTGKAKSATTPVPMKASDAIVSKENKKNFDVACLLLACERLYNKKVKSLNDRKI